jgi:hypothetical protein
VETHFASHGTGKITEIKLMNGFGFIEYEDAMDARDVVPGKCSYRAGKHHKADHCSIAFRKCRNSTYRSLSI